MDLLRQFLLFLLVPLRFHLSLSISFNVETSGILFSPYAKDNKKGLLFDWHSYSLQEVKTMMSLVSTKFTRFITFGSGGDDVQYVRNSTYFKSQGTVWAAEAAARINLEKNKLVLTLITGVWLGNTPTQSDNEFNLALESIEKANSIFERTVKGVVITQKDMDWNLSRAKETNKYLQIFKSYLERNNLTLKVGTRQYCNGIREKQDELGMERRKQIEQSDFIVCTAYPDENYDFGVDFAFSVIKGRLLQWKSELQGINPNIEVMAETGWPSNGNTNSWESVGNLEAFWKACDVFGKENNFTMWMTEAFDNPWKTWRPSSRYFGWWELKPNGNAAKRGDYIEKVSETKAVNHFIEIFKKYGDWIGIGLASLVVILVGVMLILVFRVKGLVQILSEKEIKEFKYGNEYSVAQEGIDDSTLHIVKNPYDKLHEFSKHQITIKRDEVLGSGQFGCVFLAILERDGACKKVALKMGKEPVEKSVLMSILCEIKILSYLGKNENIVSIRGAYTAELLKGIAYLATEYCELGSLQNYLRKGEKKRSIGNEYVNSGYVAGESEKRAGTSDMIRWSREIASGMEYLGLKGVIHADLATRNVLLDKDKTAKITDFGLSRKLYDYTQYVKNNQEPLPWRWMAVESLKKLEFSAMSDVWSFGVTLWEIFSFGDNPYPGLSWNVEFVDCLVNGMRMKSPSHATPEIYEIMMNCWNIKADERPSFSSLKAFFGELAESDYSILQE